MAQAPTWLSDHIRNVYSQTGEDGVIGKILETLPETGRWCVEFGASDGLFLSNTRNLIESANYSAVLIEADENRFQDLQSNCAQLKDVIPINRLVGFGEEDGLDSILGPTPVPPDFDLLSIDIDGNDYHVWKAVSDYTPRVVVIEFNPTIPTHIRFVQPADPLVSQGSSLLSLVELGREKGYELVSVLPHNAFFVRSEFYPRFNIESNAPEVLRTNLDAVTWLFSGYDGTIFLHGNSKLPWHGLDLNSNVKQLPAFLRAYPPEYTYMQKMAFRIYSFMKKPGQGIRRIRQRIRCLLKRDS